MKHYSELIAALDSALGVGKSFDLQKRKLITRSGLEVTSYSVAGLQNEELSQKIAEYITAAEGGEGCLKNLPCQDVAYSREAKKLVSDVFSGKSVYIAEGSDFAASADTKKYPLRSVEEPENDRVLRGPRDGFGEALVRNTALIRRRLRDPRLIAERISVGDPAPSDIVLMYVEGKADEKLLLKLRKRLSELTVSALNMSQESLAECLIHRGWFNPFPKIRYTERPDTAAAMLEEGSVIVLCDNTPQVMLLPTGILDFLQQTDDFYFPPLTGTYLRFTRFIIFLMSLVITPLWYLLIKTPERLPEWLLFLDIEEPAAVPLFLQLLLAEFMIDGLKLASLNTPNMLGNSLSVVGGLILGDYAVEAGWFSPQTILYMAVVAIASFTQQSYELGYAVKFLRVMLLILGELFSWWGFFGGLIVCLVLIACNSTVSGARHYLYPLFPFNFKALSRLIIRKKL